MRLLKTCLVQLLLVSALSLASTSTALALELPDVHVLPGETYPARSEGKIEGTEVAVIEEELGEKLTASSDTISMELLELSSLGPITITLTGMKEALSKTSCHTSADPAGTVKISGEYHIVDTSTAPLTAAILILFKDTVIECNSGKLKITLRAPVLVKLEKVTSGTDVTEFGVVAKCNAKGKQELKEYLNDSGVSTKAVMMINYGLGFSTACLNISKELVVKMNKMIDFLF
jgi:hypothetical protein